MKQSNDLPEPVDELYVIQRCRDILQQLGALSSLPIDVHILASLCGINRVLEKDMEPAGMLYPEEDGNFTIYLRKSDSEARKRFTCCHEAVHTFMPEFQLEPQLRTDIETGCYTKEGQYVEYLCDLGAAELLMPTELFSQKMSETGFSAESLQLLAEMFGASLEATALKMVKTNPAKYALVTWEKMLKPAEEKELRKPALPGLGAPLPKERLRVKLGYGFEGLHIPKFKSLDEDGDIVHDAHSTCLPCSGEEVINFGKWQARCKVHALPVSVGTKVLTLLEKIG